uniref:Interleukin-7 receptor subunit alpha n=1 Tax=Callorhinchus milii TaxID=7868 RepID=V9KT92_CALMI
MAPRWFPLSSLLLLLTSPINITPQSGDQVSDDDGNNRKLSCFVMFGKTNTRDTVTCHLPGPVTETLTVSINESNVVKSCLIEADDDQDGDSDSDGDGDRGNDDDEDEVDDEGGGGGGGGSCSVSSQQFAVLVMSCIKVTKGPSASGQPCDIEAPFVHLVKPETPINVQTELLPEAKEINIKWQSPEVRFSRLTSSLIHQLSYRPRTRAPSNKHPWQYSETTVCSARLQLTALEQECEYELRVRSRPDQDYFRGVWSQWSSNVHFKTEADHILRRTSGNQLTTKSLLTVVTPFVLLLLTIALTAVFWESRIKPLVWPRIANPKTTLALLRKPPSKAAAVSFNPALFVDLTITRVERLVAPEERAWLCGRSESVPAHDQEESPHSPLSDQEDTPSEGGCWCGGQCGGQDGGQYGTGGRPNWGGEVGETSAGGNLGGSSLRATMGGSSDGVMDAWSESCPHQPDIPLAPRAPTHPTRVAPPHSQRLSTTSPQSNTDQSYITMSNLPGTQ